MQPRCIDDIDDQVHFRGKQEVLSFSFGGIISSSNFGSIINADAPRQAQLAVKFLF